MIQSFRINIHHKPRERRIMNAILALATGILTLTYPTFLYLIAAGYLVALGLVFMYAKTPPVIAAIPVLTGLLIFAFPELIPITFAVFLGFFGLILLMTFSLSIMGFLTLLIAILIIMNPDSVAYFIAAFLLLYGISNLIELFQNRNINGGNNGQEVIIE
ncbi:hypothetical protein [Rhodohalobacter sp. 614A]|uniref:hypothetical protein n=1 Tax=Rhodohalobacter sp. 614A TaxID=2908649 RepID=UPI001F1C9766|nr:hypothetical protein [Rhodohalobacter sp. 614A]